MAYVDQRTNGNQRIGTIAIVTALQGAAIIALVNGLAVTWMPTAEIPNPQSEDVPITMPVEPPPSPKPPVDPRVLPENPPPLIPPIAGPIDLPPTQQPQPVPTQSPPIALDPPPPSPPPTQSAPPRAAKPRNAPGSWATTSDYPARDLREGNQGVVGFRLAIGPDGKVQSCTITRSSGFSGLDRATCDNISRRARFEPASDGSGARVAGSYSGTIRWEIPQD